MAIALEVINLVKTYANNFQALKGINLRINEGDFFALLGSNGAGKTTTINIITGLLHKTSGVVKVLGISQDDDINAIKRLVGVMPQEFNFDIFEPISEVLINQAGYYGIKRNIAKINAEKLLKKMQLWDKRKDTAKSLSSGMKRRLMLARALIHKPKILILDEPSAGVDVEIRLEIWKFLKELNQDGTTIILTTHYLEEAESLCKNIAIIDNGKVITQSSMSNLLKQANNQSFILESETILPKEIVLNNAIIQKINDFSFKVIIDNSQNISDIIAKLTIQNIIIKYINSSEGRLESLFLTLTK